MRLCIDVKGQTQVTLSGCENGFAASEASVVDEDCGVSEMCFDIFSSALYLVGRRKVAVEVVYVWWCYEYRGCKL